MYTRVLGRKIRREGKGIYRVSGHNFNDSARQYLRPFPYSLTFIKLSSMCWSHQQWMEEGTEAERKAGAVGLMATVLGRATASVREGP